MAQINREAIIDTFVEVQIKPENFLRIKETLQRIGIASRKPKTGKPTLYQTCVILQKRGKYYICHFKEMFTLDGTNKTEMREVEYARRNKIVDMLQSWGLIETSTLTEEDKQLANNTKGLNLKVIKAGERDQWILKSNYNVGQGVRRKSENEENQK